jgi:hypothetical protein
MARKSTLHGNSMGKPKQQTVAQIDAAAKQQKALEIMRAGGKLDDIVSAGLYASRGSAWGALKGALERSRREMFGEAELYRAQQLDRLESLLGFVWPKASQGDEKAVAEARRIISDIGDLTGAKMPVQIEFGEGDIDRLLAGLDKVLNGRTAAHPREVVEGEVLDDDAEEAERSAVPRALPGAG